jgi:serine/threonine protein kinase
MTSFEHLYRGLFPQVTLDCLSNYTHVRLLKAASTKNATQIDLVRPVPGPLSRRHGFELCVLKCIPVPTNDPSAQARILREVAIHRSVTLGSTPEEERILPLLSHFVAQSTLNGKQDHSNRKSVADYLILVLPYCHQGTLFHNFSLRRSARSDVKQNRGTLEESELRWTISELTRALERCHDRGIIHRDIKAENILLWEVGSSKEDESNSVRLLLCDFGLSAWVDEEEEGAEGSEKGDSTLCGTWDYMSPETATQHELVQQSIFGRSAASASFS